STRTRFRLDNFDDGSTVEAYQGRVSVLHHKNKNETRLEKGQSLSMKAGDDSSLNVGRLPEEDDFDRWVSGRIDSVSNATSAALQYTGSPYYAPDSPTSIPMAPFRTAGPMAMVGGRSGLASAGHPLPMGNGSWIRRLAGPGSAFSPGAGRPIITAAGCSTPPAAAGFIPRRSSTDTPRIQSVQ